MRKTTILKNIKPTGYLKVVKTNKKYHKNFYKGKYYKKNRFIKKITEKTLISFQKKLFKRFCNQLTYYLKSDLDYYLNNTRIYEDQLNRLYKFKKFINYNKNKTNFTDLFIKNYKLTKHFVQKFKNPKYNNNKRKIIKNYIKNHITISLILLKIILSRLNNNKTKKRKTKLLKQIKLLKKNLRICYDNYNINYKIKNLSKKKPLYSLNKKISLINLILLNLHIYTKEKINPINYNTILGKKHFFYFINLYISLKNLKKIIPIIEKTTFHRGNITILNANFLNKHIQNEPLITLINILEWKPGLISNFENQSFLQHLPDICINLNKNISTNIQSGFSHEFKTLNIPTINFSSTTTDIRQYSYNIPANIYNDTKANFFIYFVKYIVIKTVILKTLTFKYKHQNVTKKFAKNLKKKYNRNYYYRYKRTF